MKTASWFVVYQVLNMLPGGSREHPVREGRRRKCSGGGVVGPVFVSWKKDIGILYNAKMQKKMEKPLLVCVTISHDATTRLRAPR